MINAVQDVPVGPVEVDYRLHQHRGSIGDPIEEDSTSKEVFVKINILIYNNNLLTINFPFQDLPTGPFEKGHHNHHQGSVREQLEEEETFEQVIISQHQYFQKVEIDKYLSN